MAAFVEICRRWYNPRLADSVLAVPYQVGVWLRHFLPILGIAPRRAP
jgi:hypothetical protein